MYVEINAKTLNFKCITRKIKNGTIKIVGFILQVFNKVVHFLNTSHETLVSKGLLNPRDYHYCWNSYDGIHCADIFLVGRKLDFGSSKVVIPKSLTLYIV